MGNSNDEEYASSFADAAGEKKPSINSAWNDGSASDPMDQFAVANLDQNSTSQSFKTSASSAANQRPAVPSRVVEVATGRTAVVDQYISLHIFVAIGFFPFF